MGTQELGEIELLNVRSLWAHEAHDFTRWLSNNLHYLGDELGLKLELERREAQIGPYYLDILAKDAIEGAFVAIENQLEETDSTHLGQLLVYASGCDARTAIWVSPYFRDEHRAAIEWLNRWTGGDVQFFAVELRAIKIGDSLPAPEFRVVAFPQGWSKTNQLASRGRSQENQRYFEFFDPLVFELRQVGFTRNTRVPARYYQNFPSEREGISYGVAFDRRGAWTHLTIELPGSDRDGNVRLLDSLRNRLSEVNPHVDLEWHWDPFPTTPSCAVGVVTESSIDDSQDKLNQTRKWMLELLLRFKDIFDGVLPEVLGESDSSS